MTIFKEQNDQLSPAPTRAVPHYCSANAQRNKSTPSSPWQDKITGVYNNTITWFTFQSLIRAGGLLSPLATSFQRKALRGKIATKRQPSETLLHLARILFQTPLHLPSKDHAIPDLAIKWRFARGTHKGPRIDSCQKLSGHRYTSPSFGKYL